MAGASARSCNLYSDDDNADDSCDGNGAPMLKGVPDNVPHDWAFYDDDSRNLDAGIEAFYFSNSAIRPEILLFVWIFARIAVEKYLLIRGTFLMCRVHDTLLLQLFISWKNEKSKSHLKKWSSCRQLSEMLQIF